jgi:hypothetical protein
MAAAWFVGETLNAVLEKTLCPLVDKAPADTDSVGNVRDWHTISHKQNNATTSGTASRNRGGSLPRHERMAFVCSETDG